MKNKIKSSKIHRFYIKLIACLIPVAKWRRKFRENAFKQSESERIKSGRMKSIIKISQVPLKIEFPVFDKPLVSIIIPVYNQFDYTRICLYAILQNTSNIPYEIIIADDKSFDETKFINKYISNVTVIRNEKNKGFLENVNDGANYAKGKYLLLLNNDTQVQHGWLDSLLELIEGDEQVGLVGSKLVYPNGFLQEAGGIVFNDGSAANYANMAPSCRHDTMYRKDVDYVSGCCILFRKSDWDALGGFDIQYAPAYYEDTDLSFRIRYELGKRVVFQPESKVIHFEGITCGTDLTTGIKAYQVLNQQKFFIKWEKILHQYHCAPNDVFHARDRSKDKKTLAFIDHGLLSYDMDAGSKASFSYLKFFCEKNFNVKFLPFCSFKNDSPYAKAMYDMGIEIIPFEYSEEWIKINGENIDYVFLNRPDISKMFLKNFRDYSNAFIMYQGHDLHGLRMMRKYEQTSNSKDFQLAEEMSILEYDIMNQVDLVCMFSDVETRIINDKYPHLKTESLPLFIIDRKEKEHTDYIPEEREGLLFVGGFGHEPNGDAVIWFVKSILPQIVQKYPDLVFYIVGSGMTENIRNLQGDNVKVMGYLSDEELEKLYQKVRLSITPLRFGAGVKGKIIDAIRNKLPVVTTSIGAEGIKDSQNILTIGDTEEDLSRAIIDLYSDYKELNRISSTSGEMIRAEFSVDRVTDIFRKYIKI